MDFHAVSPNRLQAGAKGGGEGFQAMTVGLKGLRDIPEGTVRVHFAIHLDVPVEEGRELALQGIPAAGTDAEVSVNVCSAGITCPKGIGKVGAVQKHSLGAQGFRQGHAAWVTLPPDVSRDGKGRKCDDTYRQKGCPEEKKWTRSALRTTERRRREIDDQGNVLRNRG
jgi:hypothetical protein